MKTDYNRMKAWLEKSSDEEIHKLYRTAKDPGKPVPLISIGYAGKDYTARAILDWCDTDSILWKRACSLVNIETDQSVDFARRGTTVRLAKWSIAIAILALMVSIPALIVAITALSKSNS